MDTEKDLNTPITEEDYFRLDPNTKRYTQKNYKYSRPLYEDGESEDDSLDFMLKDDE